MRNLLNSNLVFVGQAPSSDSDPHEPMSGRSGRKLAAMLGVSMYYFLTNANRFNLNHTFQGKEGKGDEFDEIVGARVAQTLMAVRHFNAFVLLGAKVARCFAFPWESLTTYEREGKSFFLLPHPSGINMWYNNAVNVANAERKLEEFIDAHC